MIVRVGSITVSEKAFVAVCAGMELSVTPTVTLNVPDAVGVPEITPADDNVNPGGNDPAATDHKKGPVPAARVSCWEYAVPTEPLLSERVLMVNAEATVKV